MSIIENLSDIFEGVGQVVVGAAKLVYGFVKMLVLTAVAIIQGIYNAVRDLFGYAKRALKRIRQNKTSQIKPKSAKTATLTVMKAALENMKEEVAKNTLRLSDLEQEDTLDDIREIENKIARGEANGMHIMEVEDENGNVEIGDAELFHTDELSEEDKRRDNEGKVFKQPITL